MKRTIFIAALVLMCFTTAFAGEIKYLGSSTIGKLIQDASMVYPKSSFSLDLAPESDGGEQVGVKGGADIGGVARDVNVDVIKAGAQVFLIGKDAVSVIVHASNPVAGLTSSKLKDIFTGKIKNWKEVGGKDKAIKPLITDKESATHNVFKKIILGGAEYEGATIVKPDVDIVSQVKNNDSAIGQISLAFLTTAKGITTLTVDGQAASVNNPSYPITRPLYLVTKGAPSGEAKGFIDWVLSPQGQKIVQKRFIGIK
jgi:phosphate transport system substrate-binding protein